MVPTRQSVQLTTTMYFVLCNKWNLKPVGSLRMWRGRSRRIYCPVTNSQQPFLLYLPYIYYATYNNQHSIELSCSICWDTVSRDTCKPLAIKRPFHAFLFYLILATNVLIQYTLECKMLRKLDSKVSSTDNQWRFWGGPGGHGPPCEKSGPPVAPSNFV